MRYFKLGLRIGQLRIMGGVLGLAVVGLIAMVVAVSCTGGQGSGDDEGTGEVALLPTTTSIAAPRPTVAATATPIPTVAATATPIPTVAATATPIPTVVATATPTPTVVATATPIPTVAATATPTPAVVEIVIIVITVTPTFTPQATLVPGPTTMPLPPSLEIVFSDLNWTSSQVQNRIAQYIVENGYGYETSAIFGGTWRNFQGLLKGDIHIAMEVWLPNQAETWEPAVANGQVVSVGKSLGEDWQSSFVIPKYVADANPGLTSIEDLKLDEYNQIFRTTDSGGKARMVGCVVGWSCEDVNRAQIEGYGLNDYIDVVNPSSQEALFSDLQGKYDRQEPWLGYMWRTADPALVLDLVRLEEPAYTDACWSTTKACGYQNATILIAVHPSLVASAPEVVEFLRNWGFTVDVYKGVARYMAENPGADAQQAAIWFLKNNEPVWSTWVPADVAADLSAALANES